MCNQNPGTIRTISRDLALTHIVYKAGNPLEGAINALSVTVTNFKPLNNGKKWLAKMQAGDYSEADINSKLDQYIQDSPVRPVASHQLMHHAPDTAYIRPEIPQAICHATVRMPAMISATKICHQCCLSIVAAADNKQRLLARVTHPTPHAGGGF